MADARCDAFFEDGGMRHRVGADLAYNAMVGVESCPFP